MEESLVGMLVITRAELAAPGALCRVLAETPKRLRVEVVHYGSVVGNGARVHGGSVPYINKTDVWLADVTEAQYDRYLEAYQKRNVALTSATEAVEAAYRAELADIFPGGG